MIRKPFSAMIVKISTAEKAGPHYDAVTPVGNENPRSQGWWEHEGALYRKTADTTVKNGKTYYSRSTDVPVTQEESSGSDDSGDSGTT